MPNNSETRIFHGFQIHSELEGKTIFVSKTKALRYAIILGIGVDFDGRYISWNPFIKEEPYNFEPLPEELEECVIEYVGRRFPHYKVDLLVPRR